MNRQPLWYKDAIFYQLHVKCFKDGNGDGIGDFKGLKEKLDYIQNLGCTAIWLQPFYPSPLLDDGYDIADYMDVHKNYGTLADFKSFLEAAHKRGIKVVTELVINHTSSQHKWFQKSRKAKPGSKWRNYYMWSDTPDKYTEARIIFKDFEQSNWQWDPVAKAYYWHRFYSHQPDLNYDSPHVQAEILKIVDFWMGLGVDGMRLDAIPYLYAREGTDCENLPETHAFLARLRAYIDKNYPNRMLLAEANQWPEQAAKYFGEEDECQMAFHFPVMPRLFMAVRLENRFPIVDILEQTPEIPSSCQWAIFLRNHDELTLEMVTEEERDFMYRSYAKDPKARINLGIRRRLAPLLENDRSKIELMNLLLLSLPGSPIIYYGDEIGMGDNYYLGDRNGVRTPMQWNNDRNGGFSQANPQQLYLPLIIDPLYHHNHLNVENQENTPSSLLWWMRKALRVRQKYKAFGRGSLSFLYPKNNKVLTFIRKYEKQSILVVINLSRYSQYVELALKEYIGYTPREIVSMNAFAPITNEHSYGLTIGGYQSYWLLLENTETFTSKEEKLSIEIPAQESWKILLDPKEKIHQEWIHSLSQYLEGARWFSGKDKRIKEINICETFPIGDAQLLLFVQITYTDDEEQVYLAPIAYLSSQENTSLLSYYPQSIIAHVKAEEGTGVIVDAAYDTQFRKKFLYALKKGKTVQGKRGKLLFHSFRSLKNAAINDAESNSRLLSTEQSNSAIIYNEQFFLKLFRKLEVGTHPDIELLRYLSNKKMFPYVPPIAGVVEWHKNGEQVAVAIMQRFIPNSGDMWEHTLNMIRLYQENLLAQPLANEEELAASIDPYSDTPLSEEITSLIGKGYLDTIASLGVRSAEMHIAFAKADSPQIGAEPFTAFHQKAKYQGLCSRLKRVLELVKNHFDQLDPSARKLAERLLSSNKAILKKYNLFLDTKLHVARTRIHGDFHLGQILHTAEGPMIIDFEGEPSLPLSERTLKQLVLQDIAGMLRSFNYALHKQFSPESFVSGLLWINAVSKTYLQAYLKKIETAPIPLVPKEKKVLISLLDIFLLHKALYEISYEIQSRPKFISVPLSGLLNILEKPHGTS